MMGDIIEAVMRAHGRSTCPRELGSKRQRKECLRSDLPEQWVKSWWERCRPGGKRKLDLSEKLRKACNGWSTQNVLNDFRGEDGNMGREAQTNSINPTRSLNSPLRQWFHWKHFSSAVTLLNSHFILFKVILLVR